MTKRAHRFILAVVLCAVVSGCAANGVVSDRLFFGRSIPDGGSVSDEQWETFLAEVVTPRFPDGLTVWQGRGQWQDTTTRALFREPVSILELIHKPDARSDSAVASIAREYKRRFQQQAVLHLRLTGRLRFY